MLLQTKIHQRIQADQDNLKRIMIKIKFQILALITLLREGLEIQ